MSNKKNKKIQELNELREQAINLKARIKERRKDTLKELRIRNLTIFGNTINFLIPFGIAAGVTMGSIAALEGGLPFCKDDMVRYKAYSLDYYTNAYTIENESYISKLWHDDDFSKNDLTVYTPWEYENNQYVRYKRIYDVEIINPEEAFNAVKNNDYKYIEEHVQKYSEEKQVANSIDENDENDYIIIASLRMIDDKNSIRYKETDTRNLIITIVEIVLSLGIGSIAAYLREFDYLDSIDYANKAYQIRIKKTKELKKQLKETEEKIKKLVKKYEK